MPTKNNREIVVIDYGMGNVGSILNLCKKVGATARLASSPDQIDGAEKIILPGVGAFDSGMTRLRSQNWIAKLEELVLQNGSHILGICLGMQLFSRSSEEGRELGLGWIKADTKRFKFESNQENQGLRIPHMGWNYIEPRTADPLLRNLPDQSRFYFVHSYHVQCDSDEDVVAWTTYGQHFVSVVRSGTIWGTQFHPEKSHKFGMMIMKNFSEA